MTERLELYKCNTCGNLVEVLIPSFGELVCCGQPMEKLNAHKNDDELQEKHVPVIHKLDDGSVEIKVGSNPHPMLNEHYIQFIEAISENGDRLSIKFLKPGDEPNMTILENSNMKLARIYCNIHKLWSNSI